MIKIIRRPWLPTALPDLAVWYVNFAKKFGELYLQLNFTADDNTSVQNDNETVQWLADSMQINESTTAGLKTFRDQCLFGEKKDPKPSVPVPSLPRLPTEMTSSIVQRVVHWEEKIKLAETYTPDIGAQFGVITTKTGGISEENVKPKVKAFSGESDYDFETVITNRGKADQAEVQLRRPGQEKWESLKLFTGKSCTAQYKPESEGQPVKIEILIQLYRSNEKYGQPSDPVYITLNP